MEFFLWKFLEFVPKSLNRSLISPKSCNDVNPGENIPLEFRRLSTDSFTIFVASLGSYSCNPALPNFVAFRMLKNFADTQHRIWEYIDFCALKIDDYFIINWWQTCPRILPIQNLCPSNKILLDCWLTALWHRTSVSRWDQKNSWQHCE